MKYLLFALLLVAVLITAGCVGGNKNTAVTPAQTISQILTPIVTITPQTTAVSTLSQAYKTADLVLPNTQQTYGFKMDYPSDWSYKSEPTNTWGACYIFSSPDGKSNVNVYIDDNAGVGGSSGRIYLYPQDVRIDENAASGIYMYPLDTPTQNSEGVWTENIVTGMTGSYCHDGAGNPMTCKPSASGSDYYYRRLISNDAVTLSGNVKARKLVFAPDARDKSGWWSAYYLMHVGNIQGYNFTAPGHYEVGVKVDGPVWDYGMGGKAYAIVLYTPNNQVKASSDIFDHMIKSFEIIS